MTSKLKNLFHGWYVALGCCLIYFFVNSMTLFVPQTLFPRLMEEFSVNEAEISLTVARTLLFASIFSPISGILIDKYGAVKVLKVGVIIMGLIYSVYPFATSIETLYRLHFLMAIGLVCSGLGPNVIIVSNWFNEHRGKVVGMLVAGSSLGGATLPLLISPLVNAPDWGWRWGYGILAILFWVFAVIPAYTFIRPNPQAMGLHPDGFDHEPKMGTETSSGVSFIDALKSRALWCLGIGSACLWFSIQGLNSQITIFFEQEAGYTAQQAVILFSTLFWFSFFGKFAFGALSDTIPKQRVFLITSCILFIGTLFLFEINNGQLNFTQNRTQLTLFTILFGLGFGGSFSMIQLVALEIFGKAYLGRILGLITLVDGMGAALGTKLLSELKISTGSYFLPFALVSLVTFFAIINVFLIKPIKTKSQTSS